MKAALVVSEGQFRTLAENLPNHLARHDLDAKTIYVNARLEALLGTSSGELLGKTPSQILSDAKFSEYERLVLATARTGIPLAVEAAFAMPNGREIVHEIQFVPERDNTGVVTSVLTIGQDITKRKRAERDLQNALEFVQGVISAIPDTLFEVDRDGRWLNVWSKNPAMLVGQHNLLIGRTVHDVLPAEQAAIAMLAISEADNRGTTYGHTVALPLPDGTTRWFEHSVAKKPGKTLSSDRFLVMSRDVTPRMEAEQARDTIHARLVSLLHTIPDMVWMKDADGVFLLCNPSFERLLGKSAMDIVGKTDFDLVDIELAKSLREKDNATIRSREICVSEEWKVYADTGERALFETRKVPVLNADGEAIGILAVARDITMRRQVEEMLAAREHEFRTLVENSPDMVMRYDKNCRHIYVNPVSSRILQCEVNALIGKTPTEVHDNAAAQFFQQKILEVFDNIKAIEFELHWRHNSGMKRYHLFKITPELSAEGLVQFVLAVGRDITELCESREKIHRMAYYDLITGLPNRTLFIERLKTTITKIHGPQLSAVMMIDMDRFKDVNDSMGHAVGDELLGKAADRLRTCVRTCDTLARFGGDEFAILLPDVQDVRVTDAVAREITEKFGRCFVLDGREVFASCSIGIALYPIDSVEPSDLMKYADSAMYYAKRSGSRSHRFYSKEYTHHATTRLALESDLRHAIDRGELELHYQPKVTFQDHEIIGSEALLRWRRHGVGLVSPNEFIPIAEETGLIAEFGLWVLREACRSAAEWNEAGTGCHKVAVNLSARQFESGDLGQMVNGILTETGCRPEWLELEITESLLLTESDTILRTLEAFQALGISIAIDDFGTGYSSLSYLTRFPIDTLKIDRSFVQRATMDRRHGELVKAVLSIAQCLGQQVVAEGVETVEQEQFLAANGCKVAQGFLYSEPLPKSEMTSLPRYL